MNRVAFPSRLFCLLLITVYALAPAKVSGSYPQQTSGGKSETPAISKTFFGETDGQKVYQYTLTNSKGMQVKVINYGGTITDIITPDKMGEMGSVVLGFDSLPSYTGRANALMGASVGRVANRITNKQFTLDGKEYILTSNIHGGMKGFDKRIWEIKELPGKKEVALRMTYNSKDGEEGYPGNLNVVIVYTLTDANELKIDYTAKTDKATPVILTNHSYFNLSGGKDNKSLNTELSIAGDQYLEASEGNFPTGKLIDVKGTPFDFTSPQLIGSRIAEVKENNGYDLTYVLRNQTGKLALAAIAYESLSGRVMEVYTTEPGVVFYTGNYLSERTKGRGGKPFTKNGAFCLETQHFPDSPNHPGFPNSILRPGETYKSQTVYKFLVRD
ncbi:MAG: galactose mutarotase [Bacteroidales bacterium]|nr:galactose mutarotase [Bacteroidales bacterium]MDD4821604.1 galactose mutarotase [Bacteroidales bacterium]